MRPAFCPMPSGNLGAFRYDTIRRLEEDLGSCPRLITSSSRVRISPSFGREVHLPSFPFLRRFCVFFLNLFFWIVFGITNLIISIRACFTLHGACYSINSPLVLSYRNTRACIYEHSNVFYRYPYLWPLIATSCMHNHLLAPRQRIFGALVATSAYISLARCSRMAYPCFFWSLRACNSIFYVTTGGNLIFYYIGLAQRLMIRPIAL